MATKSLSEIRQLFEKLFPEQTSCIRCVCLLAESIKNAHHYAPDEWIVRYHSHRQIEGFRFIVGNLAVFDIERKRIWMALDSEMLDAIPQYEKLLKNEEGWQWKTGDRSRLKKVQSRNGYYIPDKDPSEKLSPIVSTLNSVVIKRIGSRNYKLAQRSRTKYEPAVLEFLRQELKQPIPEPRTYLMPSIKEDEGKVFYEGARKQISVKTYERDRRAREECLAHYGCRCQVCEQYMSDIYGSEAAGLIHVHHLKPLGELQEGYKVDPISDLRPVCPNCHAVIHCRKPPYTIKEVKGFWEEAKQYG